MKSVESTISPLIKNMFPSFYQEEGENFIQFVEAYYEWLEENHQQLTLQSNADFNVGDTLQQANTTGTLVAVDGNNILVRLDTFDAFRCNVQCDEFVPITSSSGGNTYIDIQTKMNPLYYGRKLFKIRDIDQTLDQFIVYFKEKYLKNIEFDIATNKQLLVKNSYDLYRSKGTERSIDLFFRLIYGVSAQVYYPGDDLFRLSAAEWVKPKYLEITNSPRTVNLVGKQITGITSGATAFVEKYIKRRVKGSFVHVLYISNLSGEFVTDEVLKSDVTYHDSPKIVGSLSGLTVTSGGKLFQVGDVVQFNSIRGDYGLARVASVSNRTGVVDFILNDGGYGYTISGNTDLSGAELAKRTQSIVSEKVLTLANVITSNTVSAILVNSGGTGYSNADTITVSSAYKNCVARPTTNSTGGIVTVTINNPGSGFFTQPTTANITITTSGGSGANLAVFTKTQPDYFSYFEPLTQRLAEITYSNASNNQLFVEGGEVYIGNSTVNNAFGIIISNANNTLANANGVLTIGIANNAMFGTGNTVYLRASPGVNANITAIVNTSATSLVMGRPTSANLTITSIAGGTIVLGDEVYQTGTDNVEIANGTVLAVTQVGTTAAAQISNLQGVFNRHDDLRVRGKSTTGIVSGVELTVGLYQVSNNYTNTYNVPIFTTNTGTIANVMLVSAGTGASFKVGTIVDTETIYLNTDLLSGNGTFTNASSLPYMSMPINNAQYGFPKNPSGNSSAVIFSCLNFDSFTIGSIGSLNQINPGTGYTVDPYVLAYQPFLSGFDLKDYYIEYNGATGDFVPGERILQANTNLTKYSITLSDESGIEVGMKVYQGSANGVVDEVTASANTILVANVNGTFQANATPLQSYSNASISRSVLSVSTESITSTAKGIVKAANSTTLSVKRTQFNNQFSVGSQITGQLTGVTATITSIVENEDVLPIGLNAVIEANVATANGTVTTLQVTDSGLGYKQNEEMLFVSEDGLRAGSAVADITGVGTGSGYYKDSKSTLSSTSKLLDGDYYQEYSYEILTRIPLDTYSEMFKKVMHTAGTRYFGGVLLENDIHNTVQYADSSVTIS